MNNFLKKSNSSSSESSQRSEEKIEPRQSASTLNNKTYFKGVASLQHDLYAQNHKKELIHEFADDILKNCNIKPQSHHNYLRAGYGRFVSNPEETIKQTYTKYHKAYKSYSIN